MNASRHGSPLTWRTATTQLLLCMSSNGLVSLVYDGFFASRAYALPLLLATVLPAGLATIAARLQWGALATSFIAACGLALSAPFLLDRNMTPSLDSWSRVESSLARGFGAMLTVGVPAEVNADTLAAPVVLSWFCTFAAATMVMRARGSLAPAVPALVCFIGALALVADRPDSYPFVAVGFATTTLLLILLRTALPAEPGGGDGAVAGTGRQAVPLAPIVLGTSALVVAVVAGLAVGQLNPLGRQVKRFDPRTLIDQPLIVQQTVTPLSTIKAQLREQPPQAVFEVDTHGRNIPDGFVRVAALESFNGSFWTSDDRYVLAGEDLGADPNVTGAQELTIDVSVAKYVAGPFLPAVGRPVTIIAVTPSRRIGFSRDSGVLIDAEPSSRLTYRLVCKLTPAATAQNATPVTVADPHLPIGLPAVIADTAARLTRGETTPYRKLKAIETFLRSLPYDLDSAPGHSYAVIERLLETDSPTDNTGFAEQHAAAFALMARVLGFRTRVAVGYRVPDASAGPVTVTTRDAHAWDEVYFNDLGWVAFDPTDPSRLQHTGESKPAVPPQDQAGRTPNTTPTTASAAAPVEGSKPRTVSLLRPISIVAGLLFVLACFLVVLIGVEKVRRRLRRRLAADSGRRVLGAWQDALDRLLECGQRYPPSMTPQELALAAAQRLTNRADPLHQLAFLVTTAAFASEKATDAEAKRAWALTVDLRRGLHRGHFRVFTAVRAFLDPRPLLSRRLGSRPPILTGGE
jgi:transglutaminase-like putative cysteine protease